MLMPLNPNSTAIFFPSPFTEMQQQHNVAQSCNCYCLTATFIHSQNNSVQQNVR